MLLANEATYRKLSTFESVEEMNEAIRLHKQAHILSDTERAVLDVISRYSCKFPGVSFLSKNKIGEAVDKVRRTVIRVCQRLEALGIIKQYETKRDGGDRRQSTNVIVILPFRNSEVDATCHHPEYVQLLHEVGTPVSRDSKRSPVNANEVTPDMSRPIETQSIKLNNIINNTYLKPFYIRFKAVASLLNIDGMQRLISRLYGVYKAHSTPLLRGQAFDKQDVEQVGIQALKVALQATKSKNIRNLAGYYNGVLDRMLDRLYFESMADIV